MIKSLKQIADSEDATIMFFRAHYARMDAIEESKENQISAIRALDSLEHYEISSFTITD